MSHLRPSVQCFLIQVELSSLVRENSGPLHLPPWVARRVDLRAHRAHRSESSSLFLCARGTPCACALLDDSAKPDSPRWRLSKPAGAALANVAYALGTKVSPAGFAVVPMWVTHLYRAASPLQRQVVQLFEFVDRLIAGILSHEARYWVRTEWERMSC